MWTNYNVPVMDNSNEKYLRLSELISSANRIFAEQIVPQNAPPVNFPDLFSLNLIPNNLSWTIQKKGQASIQIPFKQPMPLIEAVVKTFGQVYLRRFRKGKNIYLYVHPSDPDDPNDRPFCLNIKDRSNDILVRPGDRVTLSY
jgi:hypothetical protein